MKLESVSSAVAALQSRGLGPSVAATGAPKGAIDGSGWTEIVERVGGTRISVGKDGEKLVKQLTDLLKVQYDVGRYQLRIELLSKVADSALATVRKLQQPQ